MICPAWCPRGGALDWRVESSRRRDLVVNTARALVALAVGLTSEQNVLYGGSTGRSRCASPTSSSASGASPGSGSGVAATRCLRARGHRDRRRLDPRRRIALICVFTVAARRPWRTAVAVSILAALSILPALALYPVPHAERAFTVGALATFAATGWGMYVRARSSCWRRCAVGSNRPRGRRPSGRCCAPRGTDADRPRDARRAGAPVLTPGSACRCPGVPPRRLSRGDRDTAGIIRSNTHEALKELRQVISVLRETGPDPQPRGPRWPTCPRCLRSPGQPDSRSPEIPLPSAGPRPHPPAARRTGWSRKR